MSNLEYLEQWAWKIIGPYNPDTLKPLAERMDVEAAIQRSLEEREALYKQLNGVKPTTAKYWLLPAAEQRMVRQEAGMR